MQLLRQTETNHYSIYSMSDCFMTILIYKIKSQINMEILKHKKLVIHFTIKARLYYDYFIPNRYRYFIGTISNLTLINIIFHYVIEVKRFFGSFYINFHV